MSNSLRSASLLALAAAALASAPALGAQAPTPTAPDAGAEQTPVTIGVRTSVTSKILGEDRPVEVSLPASYHASTQRYPVLFVLDGESHFLHTTAAAQVLSGSMRAPEMIVVAVPNTNDRTRDLTPPAEADSVREPLPGRSDSVTVRFATAGGARRFLDFLADELAPWVDRHYRTAPYRILVGHSFGGVFVVNALMERPEAFRSYIAVSPSLWWDEGRFARSAADRLRGPALRGRSLYMTTGGSEGARMIDPATGLAAALERGRPEGFRSWYRVLPGETHGTTPHRTVYEGLETIFAPWALPDTVLRAAAVTGDVTALDAHFAALARELGTEPGTPEPLVSMIGYGALQMGLVDSAVRLFRLNAARFPASPDAHDSLANGLEAAGRVREAVEVQRRALRLAEEARSERTEAFRAHLRRLQGAGGLP